MRKLLLSAVVMTGLLSLTTLGASAAPASSLAGVAVAPAHGTVTNVDYYWHHHHYHHRRWDHDHWRYWD